MRYTVVYSRLFKKSLKRVKQLPGFKAERLKQAITLLASGERLPAQFRDHKLTGNLKEYRECHIAPDILLIYSIDDGVLMLTLVNMGSHSELF
jgi:mRNA interferase YafQ